MAKMTKRIRKNINAPIKEAEQEAQDNAAEQPQKFRSWESPVIVGIMTMTLFLIGSSWDYLSAQQCLMYILLLITLALMYAQRRMKLSLTQSTWIGRVIIILLSTSVGIFLFNTYQNYTAGQ